MINVSLFYPHNVADSCSVSNVLSSAALYTSARSAGCHFCCCYYVLYECIHKTPKRPKPSYDELKSRLERERKNGQFRELHLDVDDLQDVDALRNRKRLSIGELASMVLAKKIGQAFITDDQKARNLAATFLEPTAVQTTPHLLGWLFFIGELTDGDFRSIIDEHTSLDRPLSDHFRDAYLEAMRCRLMRPKEDI